MMIVPQEQPNPAEPSVPDLVLTLDEFAEMYEEDA